MSTPFDTAGTEWETVERIGRACAVAAAVDTGLLGALEAAPRRVEELAAELELDAGVAAHVVELLVAEGLVTRTGEGYGWSAALASGLARMPGGSAGGRTTARVSDFGISHLGEPALDAAATLPPPGATPGPSPRIGLTRTGAFLGTPAYMAPELAFGARFATRASDVYAFGLMACEMFGYAPPDPMPAVFLALAGEQPPVPSAGELLAANPAIPRPLAELVARTLALDPKARPSAEELCRALEG